MNKTEVINAINLLVREGYLLNNREHWSITGKLNRLHLEMEGIIIQKPSETSVVIKKESMTLTEFRDKAAVPTQTKTKTFTFNVGRISKPAEIAFNKIVPKISIEKLIACTKAYYANQQASRVTLTNYFTEGIWEQVYKDYIKQPEVAKPDFTGERNL